MKFLRHIARFIMGIVFIFSGFVKVIDPLGFAYKFSDYFDAFGMEWLSGFALVLGILVSSGELLIGLCLFFKLRMKQTAIGLILFMGFFTILTFIVALTNPVTDCGCFGDAIILTNWQTFFKNLIFLVPTILVFRERKQFTSQFTMPVAWSLVGLLLLCSISLSVYCLRNLPLIDFRPYHIGANISEGMEIPDGEVADEYETFLIYEKDGKSAEYTLDSEEKPWSDSTYTWIESKSVLVSKGYTPPIHDFSLISDEEGDITYRVLDGSDYTFLVVAYDLEKSSTEGLVEINEFASLAVDNGYHVLGMTSSLIDVIEETHANLNLNFDFYTSDDITLKTMIRSNPGLLLLKEGTIIGKWHYRKIPDANFLSSQGLSRTLSELESKKNDFFSLFVILLIGIVGLFLWKLGLRAGSKEDLTR